MKKLSLSNIIFENEIDNDVAQYYYMDNIGNVKTETIYLKTPVSFYNEALLINHVINKILENTKKVYLDDILHKNSFLKDMRDIIMYIYYENSDLKIEPQYIITDNYIDVLQSEKVFYFEGLEDKVIFYKKDKNIPHFMLLHNQKHFEIAPIGDISKSFVAINITTREKERIKKIKNIL